MALVNLLDSLRALNGWFWNDEVWRVGLQSMGALYDEFRLERGLQKLSDSANLWDAMQSTACEYLAVAGRQICEDKDRLGTGRSVRKEEYLSYYVNYEWPPLELFQSVWAENCLGEANPLPKRVLFYFDIEYYNNVDSTVLLLDQQGVFEALEPVYQLIRQVLLDLGIEHLAVLTGRGYNFISVIPPESPVFQSLIEIGGPVEESLARKQQMPTFKRRRRVPWQAEKSFKGALRLVLFFAGLIIEEARRRAWYVPIEMSDIGSEGISFDVTMLTRSVDTSSCAIPASPYLKLHYQKVLDSRVVNNTPVPVRLIRARNAHENFPGLARMIEVRNDYQKAFDHFSGQVGYIPDGSSGIARLAELYYRSPLYRFHQAFDSEQHDPYWDWWKTYRDYEAVTARFPHLAGIIHNANPCMLQPDHLNRLVNDFLDAGWHPKHIGGFIRAVYEDYRFNWNNRFTKYDPAKWADGWVEILGGQRFFGTG
ncbi:MAG: hypothetical protein RDV48_27815 [Candidatus Eremiobacteraeota bacterium]|nr:hypothetical protein [Candidatus Eremiobacteraeota bacterium]